MFIVRDTDLQTIRYLTTMEMDPRGLQRTHVRVKDKPAQGIHMLGSVSCHTLRRRTPKGSEAPQLEIQPRDLTSETQTPNYSANFKAWDQSQRNTNISATSHPVAQAPKHLRTSYCVSATSNNSEGLYPRNIDPKYSMSSHMGKQNPKLFMYHPP